MFLFNFLFYLLFSLWPGYILHDDDEKTDDDESANRQLTVSDFYQSAKDRNLAQLHHALADDGDFNKYI